ncbi:peroxiredoxin [Aureimonas endophytica]|uniref:thioredoxin-dependent peroxiredoxin n=1 Tax=Aureimonas endophytica TaxID=2027858 RepID=A0A916ZDH5_9HYPH|nr:peroxiredoxin [Aureimonas endophytica]GGD88585.1 peroxiredoxin [Aureimonas endophytica]
MISVGDRCPDFSLPDDRGGMVTLSELAGRPFVLFLYPKDDTSGCTQEASEFSERLPEFETIGVRVVGASPDPVKKHGKFRDKHDLTVTLLSDEEKSLLQALGVWAEKSMYGRKYMGVERTTVLFDAEGVAKAVWPKVKVPNHAAEVLEKATELFAG